MADEVKNRSQKRCLSTRKQLRVWFAPEKYEALQEAAKKNNTSIYALVHRWVDQYLESEA